MVYEGSKLLRLDKFVYSILADWHALAYLEWTHYFGEVYKHSFKLFIFSSLVMVVTSFSFLLGRRAWMHLHFYLTYLRVYVILIALVANAFLPISRTILAIFSQISGKLRGKGCFKRKFGEV